MSNTPRRRYSDAEQASALAALAANAGNVLKTARELDIPEATLRQWSTGDRRPAVVALVDEKREELAEGFAALAVEGVAVAREKLKDASAKDAAIISAVATDKLLALAGQATAAMNVNVVVNPNPRSISLTPEDIEECKRYVARARPVVVQPHELPAASREADEHRQDEDSGQGTDRT